MANRFWVNTAGGTWDSTTTSNWSTTTGGSSGASVPGSADTAIFDGNSGANTITTNYAPTLTAVTLNTGFTGTLKLGAGLTTTGAFTLTQGTFNGNAQTFTLGQFVTAGGLTRTLDLTNSTLNGLTVVQPWTVSGSNFTFISTGSTINCSIGAGTFSAANLTYNTVNFTAITGNLALNGNPTYANLTAASTTAVGQLRMNGASDFTVTGTLTLGGSSTQGINRLQVFTIIAGIAGTITATGGAVVINGDVDFQDISIAGSPSWTNTGSAFVGDCGGNSSLITSNATVPATQTWSGTSGGSWNANAWTSRVPLPQDNVRISSAFSAAQTITVNMPRIGADIDFTGTTGNPNLVRGAGISPIFFGSLTLVAAMSVSASSFLSWTAQGRGNHTLTTAGNALNGGTLTFTAPGGTYTLQDDLALGTGGNAGNIVVTDGTFTTNNKAVTCTTFIAASGRALTVNLGTSTLNLTSTAATSIFSVAANLSAVNAANSTIVVASASVNSRTMSLAYGTVVPRSYGTLTYTVANSPGTLILFGGTAQVATLNSLNVGSGRTVQFESTRTYTITNFNVNGANNGYLYLPGATGNYASAPDSAAVSLAGDMTIDVKVAMDSWTPATTMSLVSKWQTGQTSYELWLNPTGFLLFQVSTNGTSGITTQSSTAATGLAAGSTKWVRVSFKADDGAGNRASRFYLSDDGATWTQLGTTVTTAGTAVIADTTSTLEIGSQLAGASLPATGKFYEARISNADLQLTNGSVVFDADFTTKAVGANSFTESSSNAATVTINGVLAQAGDGRVAITSSTAGTAATLTTSGNNVVNVDYATIQDSTVTGGDGWFAGPNSTNVSGNTGWVFNSSGDYASDILTTTESVGYYSDLIATRESYQIVVEANVNKSDTLTTTESKQLLVTGGVAVSDTLTTTESVRVLLVSQPAVSDTLTSSESITMLSIANVNVSNTLTTTESVQLLITGSISVSNTLTTTESVTVKVVYGVTQSDNLTLTDSVKLLATSNIRSSDTLTLSESVQAVILVTLTVSVSDALTFTEVVQANLVITTRPMGITLTSPNNTDTVMSGTNIAVLSSDANTDTLESGTNQTTLSDIR